MAPTDEQIQCVRVRALIDCGNPSDALKILRRIEWSLPGIQGYKANLESQACRLCGADPIRNSELSLFDVTPNWIDPWRDELLEYALGATNQRHKADRLFRRGKIDEAMKLLLKLSQSSEALGRDWSMLGSCYYLKGNADEALRLMKLGLEKFPDDAESLLNLARLYHSMGRKGNSIYLEQAWRTAEQHLRLLPDRWEALDLQGQICQFRSEFDQALVLYEQASSLAQTVEACHWHRILLLLEMRRAADAEVLLEEVNEEFHDEPHFLYCSAELARQKGDWKSASEILKKIDMKTTQDQVLARKIKDLTVDLKYGS